MHRRTGTRERNERGFTILELMVVVMIIGILIAIGLPAMLGARVRAEDRAAEVRVRNAYTAAKVEFASNATYIGVTPAQMAQVEPSLTYNTATPATGTDVSIRDVADTHILLVTQSDSGKFMCMSENAAIGGGILYGHAASDTFAAYADCAGGW